MEPQVVAQVVPLVLTLIGGVAALSIWGVLRARRAERRAFVAEREVASVRAEYLRLQASLEHQAVAAHVQNRRLEESVQRTCGGMEMLMRAILRGQRQPIAALPPGLVASDSANDNGDDGDSGDKVAR